MKRSRSAKEQIICVPKEHAAVAPTAVASASVLSFAGKTVRIAGKGGLNADEAHRVPENDEYAGDVRAQERRHRQAGIHSVPATIVYNTHLISGGQPPEVFERTLRTIASARRDE